MIPRIERLADLPTAGFGLLQAESEEAGLRFPRRLADEWANDVNRFGRPGAAPFAARLGGELVAICGLNVDPYATAPRVGRVRHVYVLATYRRQGIGHRLVAEIIAAARGPFDSLRVRSASREASRLYEGLGFRPCSDVPDCTHVMTLTRP